MNGAHPESPAPTVAVGGSATDRGPVRAVNEDRVLCDDRYGLYAVFVDRAHGPSIGGTATDDHGRRWRLGMSAVHSPPPLRMASRSCASAFLASLSGNHVAAR